jgi:hypothetical protein
MRELRVLSALFVAGLLTLLAGGVAAGQTTCAPSSPACNAPGAVPLPSIPVVVPSPTHGPLTSTQPLDVLHRPPSPDTASVIPEMAVVGGVVVLALTLCAIVRRRRPLGAVTTATTATTATASRVLVHADAVRTVKRERWDIEAVERAAAGVDRS